MKPYLIASLLLGLLLIGNNPLPAQSDDANTLAKTQLLAANEALAREWVAQGVDVFYLNANYTVDTAGIHRLIRFFNNPFGQDVSTELEPLFELKSYVEQNISEKGGIASGNYPALRECFPNLPATYEEFVLEPKVLFTDEMRLCIQLAKWEDFLLRVVDEAILDEYWEEGLVNNSERRTLLTAYRILKGNGTPEDSMEIRNLERAALDLEGQISLMQVRKESIPFMLYRDLRLCNAVFPSQYAVFLAGETFILGANTLRCFFRRISEEDREKIEEAWESIDLIDRSQPSRNEDLEDIFLPKTSQPTDVDVDPIPASARALRSLSPSTIIIDASAQFLVERTREEIILAFFDQFQNRLDSLVELQYLFSNTYALLCNRDVLKIPSLGKAWQEAFDMDLRLLPKSFDRMVKESPQYFTLKDNLAFKLYGFTFSLLDTEELGLETGLKRLAKKQLVDCVNALDTSFFLTYAILPDFQTDIQGSFLDIKDAMDALGERERELFVAVQYQKNPGLFKSVILREGGISLSERMQNSTQAFFQKEVSLAGLFANIDRDIQAFDFPQRPEISDSNSSYYPQLLKDYLDQLPGDLATLGSITKEMLRAAFLFQYFDNESALYKDPQYLRLMSIIQGGIDMLGAVESREPSRILISTIQVLDPFFEILQDKQIEKIGLLEQGAKGKAGAEKIFARVEINRAIHRLEQIEAVSQHLGFYGGFFLDVMGAKTASEVKAALYRYALPPGSYRLKRESLFSIELGAMPAFYTGPEWVLDSTLSNRSLTSGFSAPVGLSISWGKRKTVGLDAENPYKFSYSNGKVRGKELAGWSLGVFLPILDLAAPFSFRWQNGFDEGLPDQIQWQQILAPGAYLVCGIKGLPVSLSAGAQYVPRLRSISTSGNQTVDFDAIRVGANISLDLPIFSIYRK